MISFLRVGKAGFSATFPSKHSPDGGRLLQEDMANNGSLHHKGTRSSDEEPGGIGTLMDSHQTKRPEFFKKAPTNIFQPFTESKAKTTCFEGLARGYY